ncbi:hypothetical protein [Paraburkholderia ferrariae]|uniref:hypothetical protein n=1 Tax=Paraburkholderia ferrariae TaxID=386056 RepID=UPI0014708497|nr:hypothetical protein [Paraburkholderia ferrariae]
MFENESWMWFKCRRWKKEHQDCQANPAKKAKRYPADMTDGEWAAIKGFRLRQTWGTFSSGLPNVNRRSFRRKMRRI